MGWSGARTRHAPRNPVIAELLAARVAQQLTHAALSQKTGYCVNSFMRWEAETQFPKLTALSDWAEALGLELTLKVRG